MLVRRKDREEEEEDKEDEEFDLCIDGTTVLKVDEESAVSADFGGQTERVYPDDTATKILKTMNPITTISLYSELCSGLKVSEFLAKYQQAGVNQDTIKYFIEFGLINNLIYRMHKYILTESSQIKSKPRMIFGHSKKGGGLDLGDKFFGISGAY